MNEVQELLEEMQEEGRLIFISEEACRELHFPYDCYLVLDGVLEVGYCPSFLECSKIVSEEERANVKH